MKEKIPINRSARSAILYTSAQQVIDDHGTDFGFVFTNDVKQREREEQQRREKQPKQSQEK